MAKWGEGDPRWIVEERPDATNVNNWHWSDKDASGWSQDKLKALLIGLVIEGSEGRCRTVEVISCKGEATANNRKGKLIFFYDWNIKLKWKGRPPTSKPEPNEDRSNPSDEEEEETKNEYSGEIEIPNLSEENDLEDIDVIVTIKTNTKESQRLKELMHREAGTPIRKQISEYLRCLKEEYSKDLILPRRESSPAQLQKEILNTTISTLNTISTPGRPAARPSGSPIGCRIYTAEVTMTESFLASIEDLYNALTEKALVEAFTNTEATVDAYKGGLFSILGGQITGEFVECVRPSKIVQKWRLKTWPDGHYSTVTLELKQNTDATELNLYQTEVPESDYDRTREGWKRYIFQRIKNTFGYGTQLF